LFKQMVPSIENEDGKILDAARHPLQWIRMKVDLPVQPFDMMRKKMDKSKSL
jgi:putative protease